MPLGLILHQIFILWVPSRDLLDVILFIQTGPATVDFPSFQQELSWKSCLQICHILSTFLAVISAAYCVRPARWPVILLFAWNRPIMLLGASLDFQIACDLNVPVVEFCDRTRSIRLQESRKLMNSHRSVAGNLNAHGCCRTYCPSP